MPTSFFNAILNELFVDLSDRTTVAQREQPFLKGYINFRKMGGRTVHSRLSLAGPRGFSKDLTSAQAVADLANAESNGQYRDWNVPTGRYMGSIRAEVEDVLLSAGDDDAAASAAKLLVDQGTGDYAQGFVRQVLANAFGSLGQARYTDGAPQAPSPTITTFALQFAPSAANTTGDSLNATKVQVGDQLEIRATINAAVTGSFGYVTKVDWESGVVQMATLAAPGTPANPTGWTNATVFFVFRRGEGTVTATGQGEIVASIGTYFPLAAASDTLFGVDRSISTALSGARLQTGDPALTGTLPARVSRLIAVMRAAYGMRGAVGIVCNPLDFDTYANQLDTKTRREPTKSATSGYNSMVLNTANGEAELCSEPEQPRGNIKICPTKGYDLATSNGEIFDMVKQGDEIWRVRDASQALEARPITLNKLFIGNPWRTGVVSAL